VTEGKKGPFLRIKKSGGHTEREKNRTKAQEGRSVFGLYKNAGRYSREKKGGKKFGKWRKRVAVLPEKMGTEKSRARKQTIK